MHHKLVDDTLSCVYVPIGRWSEVAEKFIVRRGQWSREERYYYFFFLLLPGKNIYSTNSTAVVVCRFTHYCYYIGIGVNTSILHITAATHLEKTENRILRFFNEYRFLSLLTLLTLGRIQPIVVPNRWRNKSVRLLIEFNKHTSRRNVPPM